PKAEQQLQLVLKADPSDATANNDLGNLWADQGKKLDEAERLIPRAIELDEQQRRNRPKLNVDDDGETAAYPDSPRWVLLRKGQLPAARRWLERAVALSQGEEDPTVWDRLGDVYFRLEEPERARTAWQKAVKLRETDRRKLDEHYKELRHKLRLL